jgi:hypothetical protein
VDLRYPNGFAVGWRNGLHSCPAATAARPPAKAAAAECAPTPAAVSSAVPPVPGAAAATEAPP